MKVAATNPVTDFDDPFGLAGIEADLAWATTGPLPSWLDGTDLSEADALGAPPRQMPIAPQPELPEPTIETLAEVGENTEPRVDMSVCASAVAQETIPAPAPTSPSSPSDNQPASMNELLDLVNLLSQCSSTIGDSVERAASVSPVDIAAPASEPAAAGSANVLDSNRKGAAWQSSSPATESDSASLPLPEPKPAASPQSPRRLPSLVELAAARDCLIVEAGARCWAVPLHAVVCLKPWPASPAKIDVDLAEVLGETRRRPRHSKRWMLETMELTFGVDGLRGPGSIVWTSVDRDEEPRWMLARANHCGESVGLIDLGHWHRGQVIRDETEAAALEPASDPASAHLQTMEWTPS